jgi:hypothetical protein
MDGERGMTCYRLSIAIALLGLLLTSPQAFADNGFDFLHRQASQQANYVYDKYYDIIPNNGHAYDVWQSDSSAAIAAGEASIAWELLQSGDNGYGGCGSHKDGARDWLNVAWYYLWYPDPSPYGDPPDLADDYDQARNVVDYIERYWGYYLANCYD